MARQACAVTCAVNRFKTCRSQWNLRQVHVCFFVATFARPSAVSDLACEERHEDSVCGDVFVRGQSGVSVTEGGTGDTLFLNGQDGHGLDTNK